MVTIAADRAGLQELRDAPWHDAKVRLENALELEQRLVVEADMGEILNADSRRLEAELDGALREARIALLSGKAFFLRSRNDLAVPEQARGAVVVERGNAEDVLGGHW
jgi:hypothetical protein